MRKTKIFAFILITAFLMSMLITTPISASAIYAGGLDISFSSHTDGDDIKGKFNYSNTVSHSSGVYDFIGEAEYYYSDSYFHAPSTEYNPHLATMSFSLCMSAFNELGRTHEVCYDNAEALLSNIGFSDIETNAETDYPPREDTIGVVVAKKVILDGGVPYTLVNITVRSGGYGSEWASNFLVGDAAECDGNHKGFYEARDRALVFICDYLQRNVTGDTKLWITGYSRGGAVSGILGAWFDDNLTSVGEMGVSLAKEDIFTYTFEAPTSTDKKNTQGKSYTNIFNIYNPADLVTYIPFSGSPRMGWNFVRPGVDMSFAEISAEDAEALNEIIRSITPYALYDIHNFTSIISALGKTQDKFIGNFFRNLALRIDRTSYVEKIEAPITEIIGNLTNRSNSDVHATVIDLVFGISSDLGIKSSMGVFEIVQLLSSFMADGESASSLSSIVGKNLVRVGLIEEYTEEVRTALSTLISAIAKNDDDGTNLLLYVANIALNTTNIPFDEENEIHNNRIVEAHLPDIVLGMLMFFDKNHGDAPDGYSGTPSGRDIVQVSVELLDKTFTSHYYKGDSVTLTANLPSCITLDGWRIGGIVLSDTEACSFTANGDISITLFAEIVHSSVSDWIVDKEPTSESKGLKYRLCTACGAHIEEAEIPARGFDILSSESDFPVKEVTLSIISGIFILTFILILILRRRTEKTPKE